MKRSYYLLSSVAQTRTLAGALRAPGLLRVDAAALFRSSDSERGSQEAKRRELKARRAL